MSQPQSGSRPGVVSLLRAMWPYTKGYRLFFLAALVATLLGAAASLLMPQVLGVLVDGPIAAGNRDALVPAALIVGGLGAFEALMVFTRRMLMIPASTTTEYRARMALFDHLVELSAAFHDRWPSGQLLTRITQDLNLIRRWFAFGLIMLITSIGMLLFGIVLMARTNWILGLVFLVGALPLVVITYRFERRYVTLTRAAQDKSGDVATVVEESVKGIRILKSFGRAPEAMQRFGLQAEELKDLEISRGRADAGLTRWLTLIPNTVIAVCLVISIWFASLNLVTMGGVVAFFATATILRTPMQFLGIQLAFALDAMAAIARYRDVRAAPLQITDPAEPMQLPPATESGARLAFRNVTFKYDDATEAEAPLFAGLELQVAPGERLALVGLTGSGKSTIIQLAARLYDVTGGAIELDGVDVRDLTRDELRSQLAVAFEDATLFSESVRDNVALGNPAADEKTVTRSLQVAAAAEFVAALPAGTETVIGEEGLSLSGGQRQRLALARAIATKPRLMLLDDPLSALDVATEAEVTAALEDTLGETTVLIVAHRPSTVALADRVALLDHGKITAIGTHDELLATNERYRYVISAFEESHPA